MRYDNKKIYIGSVLLSLVLSIIFVFTWSLPVLILANLAAVFSMVYISRYRKTIGADRLSSIFLVLSILCFWGNILLIIIVMLLILGAVALIGYIMYGFVELIKALVSVGC